MDALRHRAVKERRPYGSGGEKVVDGKAWVVFLEPGGLVRGDETDPGPGGQRGCRALSVDGIEACGGPAGEVLGPDLCGEQAQERGLTGPVVSMDEGVGSEIEVDGSQDGTPSEAHLGLAEVDGKRWSSHDGLCSRSAGFSPAGKK
jgi:hypothetical protein